MSMLKALRLSAVLLAGLALPVLAQTPSTSTGPARAVPPAPAARGAPPPAAPAPATTAPTPPRPPAAAATTAAPATAAAGSKIDINSASEQQLDALPGVGPVLAKQVIAGRPWDDLNDLVKKKALPQGVFDRNKDRLALANINTSSAADLAKTLPGIGEVRSRAIVGGRPYGTPQDLVTKKVLTQSQLDKIKDVVAY
jgi:competence protein ComEA